MTCWTRVISRLVVIKAWLNGVNFEYQPPARELEELVHDEVFMEELGGPLNMEVGEGGGVSDGDKCMSCC